MATLPELFSALRNKTGFEVVDHTLSATRLRILGRLPVDRSGMNLGNWIVLVDRLITASDQNRPWSVDVSKSYFKKQGKIVFAWRLLFQAENIEKQYNDIVVVTKTSPVAARPEPEEVRLYGRAADDNNTAGGKRGAGPLMGPDAVAIGPAAARRKQLGG